MRLHLSDMVLPDDAEPVAPSPTGGTSLIFQEEVARRMLASRRVMLTGAIDDRVANAVCSQLLVLEAEADAPIALYINSPGGEVDSGFAIYDTMQTLSCAVATVCVGLAASMAQFLLCAGTAGR